MIRNIDKWNALLRFPEKLLAHDSLAELISENYSVNRVFSNIIKPTTQRIPENQQTATLLKFYQSETFTRAASFNFMTAVRFAAHDVLAALPEAERKNFIINSLCANPLIDGHNIGRNQLGLYAGVIATCIHSLNVDDSFLLIEKVLGGSAEKNYLQQAPTQPDIGSYLLNRELGENDEKHRQPIYFDDLSTFLLVLTALSLRSGVKDGQGIQAVSFVTDTVIPSTVSKALLKRDPNKACQIFAQITMAAYKHAEEQRHNNPGAVIEDSIQSFIDIDEDKKLPLLLEKLIEEFGEQNLHCILNSEALIKAIKDKPQILPSLYFSTLQRITTPALRFIFSYAVVSSDCFAALKEARSKAASAIHTKHLSLEH